MDAAGRFCEIIADADLQSPESTPAIADGLLNTARAAGAGDIHLVPNADGMLIQWRIDGLLRPVVQLDRDTGCRLVNRLKILAGLLTYRSDVPQEGRLSAGNSSNEEPPSEAARPTRVATFPTLHGEKAAIRLFSDGNRLQSLEQLGLPDDIEIEFQTALQETSGVLMVSGPAGSGKTTTLYACLREILESSGGARAVVTLEDPIEIEVPGTSQSQIRPGVGFTLAGGLKSLMRQDPDVIMLGEIRDAETAEATFQAALTGHLVLTSFHAGSSAEALARLLDLGVQPYVLGSALRLLTCQRLIRARCERCRGDSLYPGARRCEHCLGSGFSGRRLLAETFPLAADGMSRRIMQEPGVRELSEAANAAGMQPLAQRAVEMVRDGKTTSEEVFRILGRPPNPGRGLQAH